MEFITKMDILNKLKDFSFVAYSLFLASSVEMVEDANVTAYISLDEDGYLRFVFGKEFASELNHSEMALLVLHECLHMFLGHMKIGRGYDSDLLGIATDIEVNSWILKFSPKNLLKESENLISMMYTTKYIGMIPDNLSWLDYYRKLVNTQKKKGGGKLLGGHGEETMTGDGVGEREHDIGQDIIDAAANIISNADNENMSQKGIDKELAGSGVSTGSDVDSNIKIVIKDLMDKALRNKHKKVWERILKPMKGAMKENGKDRGKGEELATHWLGTDRRFAILADTGLMLPTERGVIKESKEAKKRILVCMDMSGSCSSYSRKFAKVAANFPTRKYHTDFICWADLASVAEVTKDGVLKHSSVGYGTSFASLVEFIKDRGEKYDVIINLTDLQYYSNAKIYNTLHDHGKYFVYVVIGEIYIKAHLDNVGSKHKGMVHYMKFDEVFGG